MSWILLKNFLKVGNCIEEGVDKKNAKGLTGYTKIEPNVVSELDSEVERITKELIRVESGIEEFKDLTKALGRMGDAEIRKTSTLANGWMRWMVIGRRHCRI